MGAGTMADEPVRAGEFNAGMKAMRESIEALTERVAAIESLNQASLMAKIAEARAEGEAEGRRQARLEALEKRVDKAGSTIMALAVFIAGQALWWAFGRITGK